MLNENMAPSSLNELPLTKRTLIPFLDVRLPLASEMPFGVLPDPNRP